MRECVIFWQNNSKCAIVKQMTDYFYVILFSLIGGLFSLIGGVILLANKRVAQKVGYLATPFAAGALLGAAFFDLLPEALEINDGKITFYWVVTGIILFFLLEHYLHWFHHHHEHSGENKQKKTTAPLIIIGDTVHNFIDGIIIGAAFLISIPAGIATTLAIAAHEIPQEIGDFGVLLKRGMRRLHVLLWNAVSALATLVAALLTFWLGDSSALPLGPIFALAAGLFIYIAASDLIPTIHDDAKGRFAHFSAILLILGVLVVAGVSYVAHEQLHDIEHSHHEEH